MRSCIAMTVVLSALFLHAEAGAETIIRFGPHYGVEFVDTKSGGSWDDAKIDKQIVENGITYNMTFQDPPGVGFQAAGSLGANRRARLEDSLRYVARVLNETGTLDILVRPSQSDGTGPLAQGATFFSSAVQLENGTAFSRLQSGVKPFVNEAEIEITVDFGYNYNVGTGNPTNSQIDLQSVLVHEITHGIGFLSLVDADGSSRIKPTGPYTVFNALSFRVNTGTFLVAGSPPIFNGLLADLSSNDIGFAGVEAVTAFGGNPPVESKPPFQAGSSLSHFDPSIAGGAVMRTTIAAGEVQRTYTPVEIGTLIDLGYTNAAESNETLPACNLTSVTLLTPPAGAINLAPNQTEATVNFTAQVAFSNNPPCTQGTVQVAYFINGAQQATSTNAANNFLSTRQLAPGNYSLQAVATVLSTNNQVTSATRNISVAAAATPTTQVAPFPNLNFGEVATGSSAVSDFTVTNNGGGTLNGNAQVSGNGFTLVSGSPYTLSAGTSTQVRVRFTPSTEGLFTGAVTFTGGTNGNVVVNLTGTGGKGGGGGCSCGAPRQPADHLGDGLLMGLALSALLFATRRRATATARARSRG